ncbi:MAG: hypothetical protein A2091_11490 [Desulfuromonadales bacterium GWD2_61_12]|nr:MAG: hypothetical protein A2091_11490 [Desulfuromonadales bacterium GWD2_61_12]HAD04093.1 nucleotidyltransferase domain-containing protein [Desulfuromonas sp.]HBT82611.1 nucleotidyltransferase domain-containing protein [Desulfuromonas sp.]
MNPADEPKIKYFSDNLRSRLGVELRQLILFGSRARGDWREGSDYDFVVILREKNRQMVERVRDTEVDFLNRYDELSASLIYDEAEWAQRKRLPIGVNVVREGINL